VTTSLITGANRGLGFEVARQLFAAGHQVWIGARDDARGRQAADTVGARFVQLDVTDDASVAAAVGTVGALDVLVNNAGISGGRISRQKRRSTSCVRSTRRTYSDPSAS
jgi:NAD(P)-dependent dehydrogenase (short-subunit alcohol dehydrogenase family)